MIDGTPVQNSWSGACVYGIANAPALGRGANGVVLIETRCGHAGWASIEYEAYAAFGDPASLLGFPIGDEYRASVHQHAAEEPASRRMTECRSPVNASSGAISIVADCSLVLDCGDGREKPIVIIPAAYQLR